MPLRKPGGGYLTIVLQHQLPLILFTTLEEFRRQGMHAEPDLPLNRCVESRVM